MIHPALSNRLRLPAIAAPMLRVSGPDLVVAACRAGVIGAFPAANARQDGCEAWLTEIDAALSGDAASAPFAMNIIVRAPDSPGYAEEVSLAERFAVPIVITSVAAPRDVVGRVHDYGGIVLHDVATLRHAEKAIQAGVDGLILLTAGAGGHTGMANPFAFVSQVRAIWDGMVILAGGISDGYGIRAAEVLGADLAYIGTRFAATRESRAEKAYKALLVSEGMADLVVTDRISGLPATFLRTSIAATGLDPDALPMPAGRFRPSLPDGIKAWRDIWSAGHGVGSIEDIPPVAELVGRLVEEYHAAGRR